MQDTNYYARLKYLLISLESLSLYETTSNIYYRHKQTILLQNPIDNKYINQNENTLKNHLINTIKSINEIPIKINEKYIISDKSIYYVGQSNSRKIELKTYHYAGKIDDINIITNSVISLGNQILYYGELFQNADAKTFQLISDTESSTHMKYYKDKNNVYLDKKVIEKANPKTFSKLELGYSKDDKFVFYKAKILENVNPKSFKRDNNKFMEWKDSEGNRFDSNGRKIE